MTIDSLISIKYKELFQITNRKMGSVQTGPSQKEIQMANEYKILKINY